jgi:uncharacterized Zn-binding protein involved in type VI secretion
MALNLMALVGTGGLAAVAIVGGAVATGAGIGEVVSTMSWMPKQVTGKIVTGSPNVFINGQPAARVGDKIVCGGQIIIGSNNVFIGGGTQRTDTIQPENLVPDWVHWSLLAMGISSAVVLGGPLLALGGLAGGIAGGVGGSLWGGDVFGKDSDGQKWAMLGGALLGGALAAKGTQVLANKAMPVPITNKQGFVKGGLGGVEEAQANRAALAKSLAEQRVKEINEAPKGDFENGRKPAKTSVVVDRKTGKTYQEDSGFPHPEKIHPDIKQRMPNPSKEPRQEVENCAEFKAANKALKNGSKIEDLDIYTVNRQLEPAHRCMNCLITTKGATVLTD